MNRRRKGGPIDLDSRLDAGRKLRAMYLSLDMDLAACAQFLQVSQRTLHNWQSGRHVIPFAVYKLLRLLNRMDLPGPTWAGWYFVAGKLVSPEGRTFEGTDSSWWSLLIRQAAMFRTGYARAALFERATKAQGDERRPGAQGSAARVDGGRRSAPGSAAIGAARSAGPNVTNRPLKYSR